MGAVEPDVSLPKILLLSEIFPPRVGGSGRWFWEIYRRLPRERVVVAAGQHPQQEAFDAAHDVDMNVARVPLTLDAWGIRSLRGLRGYARAYRAVRSLSRREGIEWIHCGRLLPEGWIAWLLGKRYGLPYLCYVHGEETSYGVLSRELGWMMRRVLAGAKCVIANSHNTAGILCKSWDVPEAKLHVLHPGADTDQFVPAPRDAAARRRLGWNDRPVVLTVGRLQRRKGHDVVIQALAAVRRAIPDVLYAIVGDGEERGALEQFVRQEGAADHVQFLGELVEDRLVECYQQCDLFVLANREINGDIEGFGMVLLEAQACGKPVVAGASGGTAETMNVPETGVVVPCEGPEALAEVIVDLLSDAERRERMGQEARTWTVAHFGWEALSQQARALFELGPVRYCVKHYEEVSAQAARN